MSATQSMSPEEIRRIAEAVARKLDGSLATGPAPASEAPLAGPGASLGDGVFDTLDAAVRAARTAFVALSAVGLERRCLIIEAMRVAARQNAESLARMARDETGLGRFEDKYPEEPARRQQDPGSGGPRPHRALG